MAGRSFTAAVGTSDGGGQLDVPLDPKPAFGGGGSWAGGGRKNAARAGRRRPR